MSINITRVSTNLQHLTLLESLRQNTLRMYLDQNKLGTGSRFNAPSDDPVAAGQALNLQQALERQNQVLANIRHADSFLAASDDAVGNMSALLIDARSIASEMVTTTVGQASRDSSAELIRGMIDELIRTGNREYNGMYLFGGTRTTQPPFEQTADGVVYRGDSANLFTQVDLDRDTQINLNGANLFGAVSNQVLGKVDLNPVVTRETRLADLQGAAGQGVQKGVLRMSLTTPPASFAVDIAGAETVGDVIDLMNQAAAQAGLTTGAGAQFNASLNPAGDGLQLVSTSGTINVEQAGAGFTARDLGLANVSGVAIAGGDLQPRLLPTTALSDLFGGTGATLGSIRIASGNSVQVVDLSGASTVQEVLNAINTSGMPVRASINAAGTGLDVVSTVSGKGMSIGEAGGNTAGLLGIRSMDGGTKLSTLNSGKGVNNAVGKADFRIVTRSGAQIDVDIDGATTIQDVIARINAAATTAGVALTAGLPSTGNGIQISDGTAGVNELHVERLNLSSAADDLGLYRSADVSGGAVLTGEDRATIRPNSVFTAMQDLYDALRAGDSARISDAGDRIGAFITEASRVRGVIGARSQAMTQRLNLTEDAVTATKKLLSDVKDIDYTEAITQFQQAQTTLQANLLTGSRLLQLSLMNFLS